MGELQVFSNAEFGSVCSLKASFCEALQAFRAERLQRMALEEENAVQKLGARGISR